MFRRDPTSPPTQFSVHAEFTITHPGSDDPRHRPRTSTERDETTGGVKMTYTWQPPDWQEPTAQSDDAHSEGGPKRETWPSSISNSNKSLYSSDTASTSTLTPQNTMAPPKISPPSAIFGTEYTKGYQQGNLFFTSTPPPSKGESGSKYIPRDPRLSALGGLKHDSSGYGSDLMSPNSQRGQSLLRTHQEHHPFDRKCKSTCNITLSTNLSRDKCYSHSQCGRTQSLRCQTPSGNGQRNPLKYYGCGDPWCHHVRQGDELSCWPNRITPVIEEPNSIPEPNPFNTSNKRDASVQTFQMVDKCTSPFSRMNSMESVDSRSAKSVKNAQKYQKRGLTEPIPRNFGDRSPGAGSFTPDSLESVKPQKRLSRAPKLRRLPAVDQKTPPHDPPQPLSHKESSSSTQDSNLKKPRTVHIDVYCTGTELESDASSNDSDNASKSASTPQTVFENEKMRVTSRKADAKELPFYLKNVIGPKAERLREKFGGMSGASRSAETNTSVEREESDDDNASTAYPSKMSSYSNIGDFSASVSSVPRSWTTYSMSSCAIPEDYDSVTNTSWKDTFSDIDSLLMSRSSIAPAESLDFVPKKRLETSESIDETPEYNFARKDLLETPSSLQPSDSFEYANSEDRVRIKQMEEMWKKRSPSKPQVDKETLKLQQERIRKYMDHKMMSSTRKTWDSKESDSNDSDDSGKAWTFIKKNDTFARKNAEKNTPKKQAQQPKSPVNNLLPNTVRDALARSLTPESEKLNLVAPPNKRPPPLKKSSEDQGSLSDSNTPPSPSLTQRLSLDPSLRSPFMLISGVYTEPRTIARKFGTVVGALKKPGHHIGPAKNPDCLCVHCTEYWERVGGCVRGRTRSVGDPPSGQYVNNWKEFLGQK
ncbi:uncharacterized protein LOC126739276 [Anthonomus grandis grandis]|uniref:uncharacterized protein LOC126739276 n=1 Tax=Anthonomus grandis grandis TaxID=2921223 RepID=UPI0021659297|nr:uncharacterized protein LOC126739276 [Anthonomus grandis grandis]XP_050300840.1 uncharacterized protein LOC126739276 [Anthonomus grandis grandis]XP_050300841.1 uncharacterized protein LOC126739276 [Anthonomus grandis grandis]XP_050300842.1 uncharacterized protein LOC126739276 [Anthonomus grandis grandis]XP_050300843.1 uncharacterized protein LOC126739276 [Anthonomus grandis grandis]XP_050300844.1 uncharacterized protein LOC126739276 [Anthonomus grandis grandis]XP_050300845.1 uncharacterize